MASSPLSFLTCLRQTRFTVAVADTLHTGATIVWAAPRTPFRHRLFATAVVSIEDAPRSLEKKKRKKRPVEADEAEKKKDKRPSEADEVDNEAGQRKTAALKRRVAKHMSRMDDPWHIGNQVERILANGGFDEALMLAQKFSARMQVVVSWNHLIDHLLKRQKIKEAIKLYNDMKKRAQLPNVQTYTIIFRGLAHSDHPKYAVDVALKHYNILLTDKRLSPNSTHLNACLNVCARAEDVDSMFLIAQTANDSTRAPTAYTYTIIFNALRAHALTELKEKSDINNKQKSKYLQDTVMNRAQDLWSEAVTKWRHGEIVLDERLVCAMGRIANLARHRNEKRHVFELLSLTMNIPNFTQQVELDPYRAEMQNISLPGSQPVPVPLSKSAFYVVPGKSTLSLILDTLTQTKDKTAGVKYWNLMVRHYGIIPDADNWLRMFYMLKEAKSSEDVTQVFDILPPDFLQVKMFRLALETAIRDNLNGNAFKNATTVMDCMLSLVKVPDVHALRLYLRASLVCHSSFRSMGCNGDLNKAKKAYGAQILAAINRIWEPYMMAYDYHFKMDGETSTVPGLRYNQQREVIALARRMFAACNKIMNEDLVEADALLQIRPIAAKLNRKIVIFYENREEKEPNLPASKLTKGEESIKLDNDENDDDNEVRLGSEFVWNTREIYQGTAFLESLEAQRSIIITKTFYNECCSTKAAI
ncbi:hypothetical protein CDD82_6056 [Ophiocordyceps australis]|uniref:Pentacotripeptide-repeat region of PRORP domain-containing protein n=1 Tax=Ophiocordyceps australis TaxID=1399860 RepID=A0A2C5YY28_9HYPO|nr:hypothetical protein CDD82_6056 [Ophiocordyceps australis]